MHDLIWSTFRSAEYRVLQSNDATPVFTQLNMYLHRMQDSVLYNGQYCDVLRITSVGKQMLLRALRVSINHKDSTLVKFPPVVAAAAADLPMQDVAAAVAAATEDDDEDMPYEEPCIYADAADNSMDLDVTFDGPFGRVSWQGNPLCTLDYAIVVLAKGVKMVPRVLPDVLNGILFPGVEGCEHSYFALTRRLPTPTAESAAAYLITFAQTTNPVPTSWHTWVTRYFHAFRRRTDTQSWDSMYASMSHEVWNWRGPMGFLQFVPLQQIANIGVAVAKKDVEYLLQELVNENERFVKSFALLNAIMSTEVSLEEETKFATARNIEFSDNAKMILEHSRRRRRRELIVEEETTPEEEGDGLCRIASLRASDESLELRDAVVDYIITLLMRHYNWKMGALTDMGTRSKIRPLEDLLIMFRPALSSTADTDVSTTRMKDYPSWFHNLPHMPPPTETQLAAIADMSDEELMAAMVERLETRRSYAIAVMTLCSLFSDSAVARDIACDGNVDAEGSLALVDPLLANALDRVLPNPVNRMSIVYDVAVSKNKRVELYMRAMANCTDPVDAYMLHVLFAMCSDDVVLTESLFQRFINCEPAMFRKWNDLYDRVRVKQSLCARDTMTGAAKVLYDVARICDSDSTAKLLKNVVVFYKDKHIPHRDDAEEEQEARSPEDVTDEDRDWHWLRDWMWSRFLSELKPYPNCLNEDVYTVWGIGGSEAWRRNTRAYLDDENGDKMNVYVHDAKTNILVSVRNYSSPNGRGCYDDDGSSSSTMTWSVSPCAKETLTCTYADSVLSTNGCHPMFVYFKRVILNDAASAAVPPPQPPAWRWGGAYNIISSRTMGVVCELLCSYDVFVDPLFSTCFIDKVCVPRIAILPPKHKYEVGLQLARNIPGTKSSTFHYPPLNEYPRMVTELWGVYCKYTYDCFRATFEQFAWYVNEVVRSLTREIRNAARRYRYTTAFGEGSLAVLCSRETKFVESVMSLQDTFSAAAFVYAVKTYRPTPEDVMKEPELEQQFDLMLRLIAAPAAWLPQSAEYSTAHECYRAFVAAMHKVRDYVSNDLLYDPDETFDMRCTALEDGAKKTKKRVTYEHLQEDLESTINADAATADERLFYERKRNIPAGALAVRLAHHITIKYNKGLVARASKYYVNEVIGAAFPLLIAMRKDRKEAAPMNADQAPVDEEEAPMDHTKEEAPMDADQAPVAEAPPKDAAKDVVEDEEDSM